MKTTDRAQSFSRPGGNPGRSTLDWAVDAGLAGEVLRELAARRRRRRVKALCSLGAAALVAVAVWQAPLWRTHPMEAVATGIVVQPLRQVLPDGSVAELNQNAVIHVEYTEAIRRVVLAHGEAHFTVTKNPARPFVVAAGQLEVRAVGTAFAVDLGAAGIAVVVTEGRVALKPASGPGIPPPAVESLPTFVDAGQRVVVEEVNLQARVPAGGWPVGSLTPDELAATQAWRIPRLEFSGTPLAEALPLFNRHSSVRLVLADADMGALRLSGIIRADNTDALLRLLQANFDITAETRPNGDILLRHAR